MQSNSKLFTFEMAPEKTDEECTEGGSSPSAAPAAAAATGGSSLADVSTVSVDSTNGEHDPYFEPVVTLPVVDIKTHEEDEVEIYKGRCKLFRYVNDAESGGEWKERGTGNVKLLKHEEKGTVRLLMRQEKTLKVRANHYLTPYMKLRPNCGSDRAFVWYVMFDFADEEAKNEMFAIRFANAENARLFKEAFEEAVAYVVSTIVDGFPDEDQEAEKEDLDDSDKANKENSCPDKGESDKDSAKVESTDKAKVDSTEKTKADGTSALKEKSNTSESQIVDRLSNLQVCDESIKDAQAS
ncbi:Ran binding domain [Trinorchestia longiramus]|nr:Ran binding domain [Trinorchestia longiramus]